MMEFDGIWMFFLHLDFGCWILMDFLILGFWMILDLFFGFLVLESRFL